MNPEFLHGLSNLLNDDQASSSCPCEDNATDAFETDEEPSVSSSIAVIMMALTASELLIILVCKMFAWYAQVSFYSQLNHMNYCLDEQDFGASSREERCDMICQALTTRTYCRDEAAAHHHHHARRRLEPQKTMLRCSELSACCNDNDDDDATCPICLLEFEDGDTVSHAGNCQHLFHKPCIAQWLEKRNSCPCCRQDMLTIRTTNPNEKNNDMFALHNPHRTRNEQQNNHNHDDRVQLVQEQEPDRSGSTGGGNVFTQIPWITSRETLDPEFCLFMF